MRTLILASSSPRRKEIFEKMRVPFEVVVGAYEEDMTLPLLPAELAEFLSKGKARSVAGQRPGSLIVAADTFVAHEDVVLGKPKTPERAVEMLRMLSGSEHHLISGVTILDTESEVERSFHQVTKVFMKELSDELIAHYVKTGEPLDKAGAYALQELGAVLVDRIEGDFFNAMGLPLARLIEELKAFGVDVL